MNIEIFPAEKACEQGCSACPMARKDKEIKEKKINKSVQEIFSATEELLKICNQKYDLHFTSSFGLFPKIKNPELINMARFETNNEIGLGSNIKDYSNELRSLLLENKMTPKVIGYSVVPKNPIISDYDTYIVKEIFQEIKSWYFQNLKYRSIEATIRSNLISEALFNTISPFLFETDKKYLKGVIEETGTFLKGMENEEKSFLSFYENRLYYSEYAGKIGTNKFIVKNRVISNHKYSDLNDSYVQQALRMYVRWVSAADIAIAPRGVMLQHTSAAINNPIFWLSHKDYLKSIGIYLSKNKTFSPKRFINKIMLQNIVMFQYVNEEYKDVGRIKNDEYKMAFEYLRPDLFKNSKGAW